MEGKKLYFLRGIKTGSTTIISHFIRNGKRESIISNHDMTCPEDTLDVANVFTVIRDPADWQVSIYHQAIRRMGSDMSFEAFYERTRNNPVNPCNGRYNRECIYFDRFFGCAPQEVGGWLEKLWGVTVTDKLDEDLPLLFEYYGLPAAGYKNQRVTGEYDEIDKKMTPKVYTLTDEMRKRIYNENPLDVQLYELAKELRIQWLEKLKREMNGR
jgi:hypothetical protein